MGLVINEKGAYFFRHDGVNDWLQTVLPTSISLYTNISFFIAFDPNGRTAYYNLGRTSSATKSLVHYFGAYDTFFSAFSGGAVGVENYDGLDPNTMNYVAVSRDTTTNTEHVNVNGIAYTRIRPMETPNDEGGLWRSSYQLSGQTPIHTLKEYTVVDYTMTPAELAAAVAAKTMSAGSGNYILNVKPTYPDVIQTLDPNDSFVDGAGNTITIAGKANPMTLSNDFKAYGVSTANRSIIFNNGKVFK